MEEVVDGGNGAALGLKDGVATWILFALGPGCVGEPGEGAGRA